ncbi:retrovirus-related pol polyprotein from transposon TNT 1-94, partial [Tanacetum coccineum]
MELRNVKEAMPDPAWIDSMQEELLQFKRLNVWVLVPAPDNIKTLTLKWLFKNKHDEDNTIIRNKLHLIVRGYLQKEGIDSKNHSLWLLGWKLSRYFWPTLHTNRFIDADHPSHVYKLKKTLYGLKQAPRA